MFSSEQHRDRKTEVGTYTQCIWDNPRKKSNPQGIIDIDMRVDKTQRKPNAATTDSFDPIVLVQGPQAFLDKEFYELCRCTDAFVLQTLYDKTFESDDDDNVILSTMPDACKNMQPPFCQLLET